MADEQALDPSLPIIDPHHHLWDRGLPAAVASSRPSHPFEEVSRRYQRYLLDEMQADLRTGHNIRATVFVECRAMYRADGPEALRTVGETEFANGVAAMSASGMYGESRVCAAIVGRADLTMGDAVSEVLEAHVRASSRFRGIRNSAAYDPDPAVLGPLARNPAGLYESATFRQGFARLAEHNLTFDAWVLEPQLPDLIALASAFPEQAIVLDHVATPLGSASYAGRRAERFEVWRANIRALAKYPSVVMKLGGLGMFFCGFEPTDEERGSSEWWAAQWRPYIETCIEAFGANRCMFESNFPVDKLTISYVTLWNAFKRIAAAYSKDEVRALFAGTAERVYRL